MTVKGMQILKGGLHLTKIHSWKRRVDDTVMLIMVKDIVTLVWGGFPDSISIEGV